MEIGKKYKITLIGRFFFGIYKGTSEGYHTFFDDYKDMEIVVKQDAPILIEDYRRGV